jgi:hypothetical protein
MVTLPCITDVANARFRADGVLSSGIIDQVLQRKPSYGAALALWDCARSDAVRDSLRVVEAADHTGPAGVGIRGKFTTAFRPAA